MKCRISSSNERVWCTTQLAKLRFNHSIVRTHSWPFQFWYIFYFLVKSWKTSCVKLRFNNHSYRKFSSQKPYYTNASDVPRSLQSWVSTIQSVVLTADVFQLFPTEINVYGSISTWNRSSFSQPKRIRDVRRCAHELGRRPSYNYPFAQLKGRIYGQYSCLQQQQCTRTAQSTRAGDYARGQTANPARIRTTNHSWWDSWLSNNFPAHRPKQTSHTRHKTPRLASTCLRQRVYVDTLAAATRCLYRSRKGCGYQ